MTQKTLKHFLSWEHLGQNLGDLVKIAKSYQMLGGIRCLDKILGEFRNLGDLGGLLFLISVI